MADQRVWPKGVGKWSGLHSSLGDLPLASSSCDGRVCRQKGKKTEPDRGRARCTLKPIDQKKQKKVCSRKSVTAKTDFLLRRCSPPPQAVENTAERSWRAGWRSSSLYLYKYIYFADAVYKDVYTFMCVCIYTHTPSHSRTLARTVPGRILLSASLAKTLWRWKTGDLSRELKKKAISLKATLTEKSSVYLILCRSPFGSDSCRCFFSSVIGTNSPVPFCRCNV